MTQPISRRTALRGLGTVVALPWLEAMAPRKNLLSSSLSTANTSPGPFRTAFIYVPNGMHMPHWTPAEEGSEFEMPKILQPLKDYKSKTNVYSGLTLDGARAHGDGPGDHARSVAAFLTGAHPRKTDGSGISNGTSIDQVLATAIGQQTRLPSLEVGMERSAPAGRCDSGYSCVYTSNISWRTPTTPVAKEINPGALFDRLFGGPDARISRQMAESRKIYRRSVLDLVGQDARSLKQHLGSDDRRKLDEYLHAVRDVERRLNNSEKLAEKETEVPDYPRPQGIPREFEAHMKLLFDVMALAFQSDSTRIMSFMFANAGSNRSYRKIGVNEGHHDLSHHGNSASKQKKISQINSYHAQQLSYFVDRLNSIPEGEHTVLDNTLILYGSGIADGNRHAHHGLPIVTIGDGGGRFQTGQHMKFAKETPLCNLYLTILRQSGSNAKSFGDSKGTINEIIKHR